MWRFISPRELRDPTPSLIHSLPPVWAGLYHSQNASKRRRPPLKNTAGPPPNPHLGLGLPWGALCTQIRGKLPHRARPGLGPGTVPVYGVNLEKVQVEHSVAFFLLCLCVFFGDAHVFLWAFEVRGWGGGGEAGGSALNFSAFPLEGATAQLAR